MYKYIYVLFHDKYVKEMTNFLTIGIFLFAKIKNIDLEILSYKIVGKSKDNRYN